jgi:hypothetical protein
MSNRQQRKKHQKGLPLRSVIRKMTPSRLTAQEYADKNILPNGKTQGDVEREWVDSLRRDVVRLAGRPFVSRVDVMDVDELTFIVSGLESLKRLRAASEKRDSRVDEWVRELRSRGVSWNAIGTALGISKQAAAQKFGSPS